VNRLGIGGVGVDVTSQLAGQIGHGGKDAAGDDFTLDFGEPQFDLVEPGGVSGREVESDMWILFQELPDQRGLVEDPAV
jgi:hypothetical protein